MEDGPVDIVDRFLKPNINYGTIIIHVIRVFWAIRTIKAEKHGTEARRKKLMK